MKRMISLILAFTIMISMCACQGSFGSVNLSDSVEIPDDGIIQEKILTISIKDRLLFLLLLHILAHAPSIITPKTLSMFS